MAYCACKTIKRRTRSFLQSVLVRKSPTFLLLCFIAFSTLTYFEVMMVDKKRYQKKVNLKKEQGMDVIPRELGNVLRKLDTLKFISNDEDRMKVGKHSHVISKNSNVISKHSNVISKHSNVISEHSNVISKHSNVISKLSNVMNKHSNVIIKHSNVISKHSNVISKHSNVISKHSNVITEHSNVISKHSNVISKHSNVMNKHSNVMNKHSNVISKHSNVIGTRQRSTITIKNITHSYTQKNKSNFTIVTAAVRKRSRHEENCKVIPHPFFHNCAHKILFLKQQWMNDKCFYETHSVDGSQCSIMKFLTRIEPHCLGERGLYESPNRRRVSATPNFDLDALLNRFSDNLYDWLKERARFLWSSWSRVGRVGRVNSGDLPHKGNSRHTRKKVVTFLASFGYQEDLLRWAGKGGPLGELIQWTDLITALHILGHDVHVVRKMSELVAVLKENKTKCASGKNKGMVDIIYTDINGVIWMINTLGGGVFARYKCMLRVLDSFGTYSEFNFPHYPHPPTNYGDLDLIPTQFLTLYPHTHDNRFLGFVIPSNGNRVLNMTQKTEYRKPNMTANTEFRKLNVTMSTQTSTPEGKKKEHIALLYAKICSYIKGKERYLEIVSEYFEIHATCFDDNVIRVPSFITNHGPVSGARVQELLSNSKLFIGVGFPYEGPGPLEAMSNGVVYIQPKLSVPVNRLNTEFFAGKPTLRKLSSQNPYMEEFIGEPYCYTVDITDETVLRRTLQTIKTMKRLPGKIPREFTVRGFTERVHVLTDYIDYCNPYAPRWPPLKNMQIFLSLPGQSCKEACMSKGLLCERTYFHDINTANDIKRHINSTCQKTNTAMLLHAPSVDMVSKVCYLQAHVQMYSCHGDQHGVTRLCPCRDYEHEQTAICKKCL